MFTLFQEIIEQIKVIFQKNITRDILMAMVTISTRENMLIIKTVQIHL